MKLSEPFFCATPPSLWFCSTNSSWLNFPKLQTSSPQFSSSSSVFSRSVHFGLQILFSWYTGAIIALTLFLLFFQEIDSNIFSCSMSGRCCFQYLLIYIVVKSESLSLDAIIPSWTGVETWRNGFQIMFRKRLVPSV